MAVVAGSHPYDPGDCLNRHCIFSPIGDTPFDLEKVRLGDWLRGEHYLYNILEDLNHWVVGWTDWNLALDMMASFLHNSDNSQPSWGNRVEVSSI